MKNVRVIQPKRTQRMMLNTHMTIPTLITLAMLMVMCIDENVEGALPDSTSSSHPSTSGSTPSLFRSWGSSKDTATISNGPMDQDEAFNLPDTHIPVHPNRNMDRKDHLPTLSKDRREGVIHYDEISIKESNQEEQSRREREHNLDASLDEILEHMDILDIDGPNGSSSSNTLSTASIRGGTTAPPKLSRRSRPITRRVISNQVRDIASEFVRNKAKTLGQVIRGDVAGHIPPDIFGETLDQEIAACHSSVAPTTILTHSDAEKEALAKLVSSRNPYPHDQMCQRKLYGGAQYHRTLRSFHERILQSSIPTTSYEEITQLLHGLSGDVHDGPDYLRAVAKIASRRMQFLTDCLLTEIAQRVEYVLVRMWNVVEYSSITRSSDELRRDLDRTLPMSVLEYEALERDLDIQCKRIFESFVEEKVEFAYAMASEDIYSMLKFISWDLAFGDMREAKIAANAKRKKSESKSSMGNDGNIIPDDDDDSNEEEMGDLVGGVMSQGITPYEGDAFSSLPVNDPDTDAILSLIVQAVQSQPISSYEPGMLPQTYDAINTLVDHVTKRWRHDISHIVMTKFNVFCLLAFHDEFAAVLRKEISKYLEQRMDDHW